MSILALYSFGVSDTILSIFLCVISFGVYVGLSYLLIFKTRAIIEKLKLDKDLGEQNLNMQLSKPWILEIALIITGSVILIDEIPNLCRYLFKYYEERKMTYGVTQPEISYSVFAAVKILLALLIIGERKRIIRFIDRKEDINQSE